MTRRPRALLAMSEKSRTLLFDAPSLARLEHLLEVRTDRAVTDYADLEDDALAEVEYIIGGWGAPFLDKAALDRMPRLRAFVHTAGTVKEFVAPEAWARPVIVTSAVEANAKPVAEFTLAAILLSGKRFIDVARHFGQTRKVVNPTWRWPDIGNYGKTVGIIGASRVGRRVVELLRPFDYRVLLSDPTIDAQTAAALGAELVDLDTLMRESDIVSVHAPRLPSTIGMVNAERLALMRPGSTLINTARGALVDHGALIDRLSEGSLTAILDVTEPEHLPEDSPLWTLPNAILTPHIAGSLGTELRRLVASALGEIQLLVEGQEPSNPVPAESLSTIA